MEELDDTSSIAELIARARARGGAGLDPALRGLLEQALGTGLGDVQLHASREADQAARALDAAAFTLGHDVFFASGQLEPSTQAGRGLLAHEVAHTVQQRGAATEGPAGMSAAGDPHELEAERFASAFLGGGSAPVGTGALSRVAIARQPKDAPAPAPLAAPQGPAAEPLRSEIVQDRPLAVVGQSAILAIPGAERYQKRGQRYLCWWTIELDERAVKATGVAPEDTHRPDQQTGRPSIRVAFEVPGTHRVRCKVQWEGKDPPPARAGYALETTVTTRRLEDISNQALDRFEDLEARSRVGRVLAEATDPDAAKAGSAHDRTADQLNSTIAADKRVPVRAVISSGVTGNSYALSMVIGPSESTIPGRRGPIKRNTVKLIDTTPGVKRAEYAGGTAQQALDDLRSGNSYPEGMLELEIPTNDAGIPAMKTRFKTSGMSNLEEWAHALGLVSIGLAAIATMASGGLTAPLLVWASTATAALGAGMKLADDFNASKLDKTTIAVDVIQLTASLLPFVGPAARLAAGTKNFVELAQVPGKWIQLGQVAVDGVGIVLISAQAYDQLIAELAKPELKNASTERDKHIILFVAQLIQNGAIIGISAKGAAAARPSKPTTSHPPGHADAPAHDPADVQRPRLRPGEPAAAADEEIWMYRGIQVRKDTPVAGAREGQMASTHPEDAFYYGINPPGARPEHGADHLIVMRFRARRSQMYDPSEGTRSGPPGAVEHLILKPGVDITKLPGYHDQRIPLSAVAGPPDVDRGFRKPNDAKVSELTESLRAPTQ